MKLGSSCVRLNFRKSILGNEDFDLPEDLDKSMEMFSGMLKAKDDEIEMLNIKLLDMQKEFEFQVEKDKDFEVLEKLAEDEADTIGQLEKENCKLTEALNHVEKRINHDKEKWKSLEVSDKLTMSLMQQKKHNFGVKVQ